MISLYNLSNWLDHNNPPTKTEGETTTSTTNQQHNGPHQTKQNGCLVPAITLGDENQNTTADQKNKRSSLLADEEDLIPLIDIQSSSEDIPEMVNFPAKRQNSASTRQVLPWIKNNAREDHAFLLSFEMVKKNSPHGLINYKDTITTNLHAKGLFGSA